MKDKISLKYIYKLLLENRKLLILGQFITIIAIIVSVPIPLLLPMLVDEVLLNKPDFFVNNIDKFLGIGNAFYYIAIVTFVVVFYFWSNYYKNIYSNIKICYIQNKRKTFKSSKKSNYERI